MRLDYRQQDAVTVRGSPVRAAIRRMTGALEARRYGEYLSIMYRLILPYDTLIYPGDEVRVGGDAYLCVAVRQYRGHIQADIRRRAP